MKRKKKKLMTIMIIHSTEKVKRYKYKYNTYTLHSAESKLVHRYLMISHMIILSNPLAPSFTFGRGDTRRINALGLYSYGPTHDLQKVNASGHNAKQSFRYLVTIRRLNSWAD